jgi:hypothetical protein
MLVIISPIAEPGRALIVERVRTRKTLVRLNNLTVRRLAETVQPAPRISVGGVESERTLELCARIGEVSLFLIKQPHVDVNG